MHDVAEVMPFAEWRELFGKSYSTAAEEREAAKVFADNVEYIARHNAGADAAAHSFR